MIQPGGKVIENTMVKIIGGKSVDYKVLGSANINKKNVTGKTVHKINDEILEAPTKLTIVQYQNDNGVYLLYFNSDNQEITDTYHDNLQTALDQAKFEFNLDESDWSAFSTN